MNVTLEQARTLDAFAAAGSLQGAARAMHKAHSAVLYALKQLEAQTGLALLDRTGYRTTLTAAGVEVLRHCRRLLEAERALASACEVLATGWEPVLTVVFDAVIPLGPMLEGVRALERAKAPTRVRLVAASLGDVEARFVASGAQLMLSVLPVQRDDVTSTPLPKLKGRLVAHRGHPLARAKAPLRPRALEGHTLLTVQGSDPRLRLATGPLEPESAVHLPDFHVKKAAILAGLGYGWLPDWLIEGELRARTLRVLALAQGSAHTFEPRLYAAPTAGPAAALWAKSLRW